MHTQDGRPLKCPKVGHGTQEEFESDLCKLFIACGVAWNSANNPQTHKFAERWFPANVLVPDCRILSGRVLDKEATKVEDRIATAVKGKFATGQGNGWKNVAKTSVITTVMTVEREVR